MQEKSFKQKLAKLVLGLFLLNQILWVFNLLGAMPTVYAQDQSYDQITDTTTVTWDNNTAEYVLFTGENKVLTLETGAKLTLTWSVSGYPAYNNQGGGIARIQTVIGGVWNSVKLYSWSNLWWNFMLTWTNNRLEVENAWVSEGYFLYWSGNEFNLTGTIWWLYIYPISIKWNNIININNGSTNNLFYVEENSSLKFNINNWINRSGINSFNPLILMLKTWANATLNYTNLQNANIYLYTGSNITINGYTVNRDKDALDCEFAGDCWPVKHKILYVEGGKLITWNNLLNITTGWDYSFNVNENKYNIIRSTYTGSDVIIKLDNINYTGFYFGRLFLTWENKVILSWDNLQLTIFDSVPSVNWIGFMDKDYKDSYWLSLLYRDVNINWKKIYLWYWASHFCNVDIDANEIFIRDFSSWGCENLNRNIIASNITINQWNVGMFASKLININTLNSKTGKVTIKFNTINKILSIGTINKSVVYSGDNNLYVYSGDDLLSTWDTNTVYFCNNVNDECELDMLFMVHEIFH